MNHAPTSPSFAAPDSAPRTLPDRASAIGLAALLLAAAMPCRAELRLTLRSDTAAETLPASNVVLYVAPGTPPSPFLEPGPFTATWTGSLEVDLRGEYRFLARHAGAFSLQINGTNVLEASDAASPSRLSLPVRLRKGTNAFRAILSRTNLDEAFVRLEWSTRGAPPSPIPPEAFTPPPGDSEGSAPDLSAARRGRHLFVVHRCARCHDPEVAHPVPDLLLEAPTLAGIGSRRRAEWLAEWVLDPRALQPTATMPAMASGPDAASIAADIGVWLGSLEEPPPPKPSEIQASAAVGYALVEALLCRSCHTATDEAEVADKISWNRIARKFATRDVLTDELRFPHRRDPWRRMPDFGLTPEEAEHVAAYLLAPAGAAPAARPAPDPDRVRRGRQRALEQGCFRCHADPEAGVAASTATASTNAYPSPPPVRRLTPPFTTSGCIADHGTSRAESRAPRYGFDASQRADLGAFLASDIASLGRHVASEFAERWSRELRCGACHDRAEGLPRLAGVGAKLRPEWLARCLAGDVGYKPRPWLKSRMPGFRGPAALLAEGLAAAAGNPPGAPVDLPADPAAAEIGRKLVAASAGFACVTCHAVGRFQASAVFEAPGVNLAHTSDRLLRDFFVRWVRNPQSVDPTTKMPLYFDEEGNSALADYYGGDGPKTLNALWEYLRPGASIRTPDP